MFRARRVAPEPGEVPTAPATTATLADGAVVTSWGAGTPVLLVHGWEGCASRFGRVVDALVASERRVVAVDGPGHGRSPDGVFTPSGYGQLLLEAAQPVGQFDAVVAHSFGSLAAFFALRRGLRAQSIVLIAPLRSLADRLTGTAEHFGFHGVYQAEFLDTIAERLGMAPTDLDLDAQPIPQVPVLLCHDTDDQEIPFDSTRHLARHWPQATLLRTTGLRHRRILQEPAVVEATVGHIAAAAS